MRAAICTKYGPPNVVKIEEWPKSIPKDNEILVRVHASTVASGDCRVRGANVPALYKPMLPLIYGFGRPRQPILGAELSGQIEAIGKNVTAYKNGESIFAMIGFKMGAHAEYVTLPENGKIAIKPEEISYEQAASLSFGGTTALHFFRKGNLEKGQKILIYGASGAVGTSAVQLAKYFDTEVTGVCSGSNAELVKSIGADFVIDYTLEDFRNNGKKYDIIFDAVGKITKPSCREVLSAGGRYITVNGAPAKILTEDMILLGKLAQSGKFKPVIDRTYPLEQITDAYAYVETGRKKGSVVITI